MLAMLTLKRGSVKPASGVQICSKDSAGSHRLAYGH